MNDYQDKMDKITVEVAEVLGKYNLSLSQSISVLLSVITWIHMNMVQDHPELKGDIAGMMEDATNKMVEIVTGVSK